VNEDPDSAKQERSDIADKIYATDKNNLKVMKIMERRITTTRFDDFL